jgi:ABC-type transport system substrate-binding protein
LVTDLETNDIPVTDYYIEHKEICFKNVKVDYNYHLYTGGWVLCPPADYLHHLFHSSMYWYPVGWSSNYPGFCHTLADQHLNDVKYSPDIPSILAGVGNATFLLNKYVPSIPLWSSASATAYLTGWDGTINMVGKGKGNYWTFFNMRWTAGPPKTTINWGFWSAPMDLNVITAEWKWDREILGLIYESLLILNPYNLGDLEGMLATSWSTGTWDGTKVYVDFTLKSGVKFHDCSTLTAEDVKWSMEFMRDCGFGVAWTHPVENGGTHLETSNLEDLHNVTVLTPGEGGTVRVYFSSSSLWALRWAGSMPILNPKVWQAADAHYGWGYHASNHSFTGDRFLVRNFHPHSTDPADDFYDVNTQSAGSDGLPDLCGDGTGPWVFLSPGPAPELSQFIDLVAFRPGNPSTPWITCQHHLSQAGVAAYLIQKFHEIGNVNYPGSVNQAAYLGLGIGTDEVIDVVPDLQLIEHAAGCTSGTCPAGIGWNDWNEDADINSDGFVDAMDYTTAAFNLGKTAGC